MKFLRKIKYRHFHKKYENSRTLPALEGSDNISRIDIVFENCECYTVPRRCLSYFCAEDIRQNAAMVWPCNVTSSYVEISLTDEGMAIDEAEFPGGVPLGERLKSRDITHIDVWYGNKRHCYITVPWKDKKGEEFPETNMAMRVKDNTIIIGERKWKKK